MILNNSTAKQISHLGRSLVKEVNPVVLDEESLEDRMSAKQVNEQLEEAESARNLLHDNSLEEVKVPDLPEESHYSNPYGEIQTG